MTQRDITVAIINRILVTLCLIVASAIVLLAAPKKDDPARLQQALKTYVDKEAAAVKVAGRFGEDRDAPGTPAEDGSALPTAWDATKKQGVSLADIVEYRRQKDARYWQIKKEGLLKEAQVSDQQSKDHMGSARDLGIGFSVDASIWAVLAAKASGLQH